MKKFVVLLTLAIIIGFAISRLQTSEAEPVPDQQNASDAADAGEETHPLVKAFSEQPASPQPTPKQQTTREAETGETTDSRPSTPEKAQIDPQERSPRPSDEESAKKTQPPAAAMGTEGSGDQPSGAPREQGASSPPADPSDLHRGIDLAREGSRLEARKVLSTAYLEGSEQEQRRAREVLESINEDLVFNPRVRAGATIHTVEPGDTLGQIGQQYGVNWRMIQRLNGISRPERIQVGQKLKILTGPQRIVVSKSTLRLALFIDGLFIKEYPVGLGKDDGTPAGSFEVGQMLIDPDWYPPKGGVIKYGQEGHLIGDRWIGFRPQPGLTGYGIHGTNEPESIGTFASEGCVRMHNEHVKELYDLVGPGTTVTIVE